MADCRIVSVRIVSLLKVFALILWVTFLCPNHIQRDQAKESLYFSQAAQCLVALQHAISIDGNVSYSSLVLLSDVSTPMGDFHTSREP